DWSGQRAIQGTRRQSPSTGYDWQEKPPFLPKQSLCRKATGYPNKARFPLSSHGMSPRRFFLFGFALLVCVAFGALELTQPLVYVRLCNLYRDVIPRSGRTTAPTPNLVFLAIDAPSVFSLDENDIETVYGLAGDKSDNRRVVG